MDDPRELLAVYDEQLRADGETPGALAVTVAGPLHLATFHGGRGFVTYRDLGGADADGVAALVETALEHFRRDLQVREVEWKTRGHDHAPGLHEALVARGFVADEPETIMLGPARALAAPVTIPDGVTVSRVHTEADVREMCAMLDEAFGAPLPGAADDLLGRLRRGDGLQLWLARDGERVVAAGRLEPVAGTRVAGIWGGATLPAWRRRGIYRALVAARARAALEVGATLIHSDCNPHSRPVLERMGLVAVSTTTPYRWRR